GTYVLEPAVFDLVPEGARMNIEREVFPALVGKGLHAVGFDGYWNDIGTFDSYRAANQDALAGRIAGIAPTKNRSTWIADDARVASGATIAAGAVIGSEAVVEDGAWVGDSILLERAFVGREASVEGAILGEGSRVEPASTVDPGTVLAPA
ncbi:MAG: mannose-phosphate guanyltransferase, partial [Thermoleophilia bacterium]|nr:mannose-phosphate guanyltransferase [Thermoleophilia bacterium]